MSELNSNNGSDDAFEDVLGGLEQLAGGLDAGQFPGRAWPASRVVGSSHRVAWKLAVPIAAAAALVAVALWRNPPRFPPRHVTTLVYPKSIRPPDVQTTQAQTGPAMPNIVIVEDMDSYSIIDMTGDVPLVSFARRDSDDFDDAGPVFVGPALIPTTKNAPL